MASSTIPALKAALVARLAADASIVAAGVQVTYGDPYPAPIADEWIWVGSTNSTPGESAAALGMQRREERYTLDVTIGKRDDSRALQKAVTERAFLLASYIENSMRSWGGAGVIDPFNYSTTGVRIVQVINAEHTESVTDAKRFAVVHLTLSIQARI